MRKVTLRLILLGTIAIAQFVFAQAPTFDVVSVKPSPPEAKDSRTSWEPNRLIASGVNLKQLIEWAYQVTDIQVSGGPGWMDSRFFDMEAKVEGAHTRNELLQMLQPALAERFKLALHRETKELPVYVLLANANRGELHEPKGGPSNIQLMGVPTVGAKNVSLQIIGQSVSMQYLTSYLTNILGRLVIDRTNLTKSFDFRTEVTLEENDVVSDKRSAVGTALMDAMPRLGLKLDSRKESVEVLIIDRAEEPSPN
jgi:uncharacterized protein (TIGR03435 family)